MPLFFFFFFNAPAPTEIYPLSLHDALPICARVGLGRRPERIVAVAAEKHVAAGPGPERIIALAAIERVVATIAIKDVVQGIARSEEHTSELQSHHDLVCRLLLETKKKLAPTQLSTKPLN